MSYNDSPDHVLEYDQLMSAYISLEKKTDKLKRLLLLTDDSVSNETVGEIQIKQWNEFTKVFPEEK